MTSDEEYWAEALAIERQHGDEAVAFVDERFTTLTLNGDIEGALRWLQIAGRLYQLKGDKVRKIDPCRSKGGGEHPGQDGMTPDEEFWAEALMVEKQHGDRADAHIAERVTALTLAGDDEGVARWLEIAARLDQLKLGDLTPS